MRVLAMVQIIAQRAKNAFSFPEPVSLILYRIQDTNSEKVIFSLLGSESDNKASTCDKSSSLSAEYCDRL